MPPNIGRVWACDGAKLSHCGDSGNIGGITRRKYWTASSDILWRDLHCHAVTLCNAESVTLQELVTGVRKCFPGSAFHDSADTCNAAEFSPAHAVDHVPVIVMAEVLRISQNFRLPNWLEMPHNLSSLVIISYSLIIISFLHPFLNKAAPHRCFFGKNANLPISYF